MEYEITETFLCSIKSFHFFQNIIICYRTVRKTLIIFFLVLYNNDTWIIPKLIDSVCNLVNGGDEIIIIAMISSYFQVWNNIEEKFAENFCYSLIFWNYTAWKVSKYGVFSSPCFPAFALNTEGPCFPAFALNTERYAVKADRKSSVFRHFSRSDIFYNYVSSYSLFCINCQHKIRYAKLNLMESIISLCRKGKLVLLNS